MANPFYGDWSLMTALLGLIAPVAAGVWWVLNRDDQSVYASALKTKQVLANLLMGTVAEEARQLMNLIDEHLPRALAQASKLQPELSRFDYFCESLRKLTPSDLDDRARYANIIKDAFAGLIADSVENLLSAATASRKGTLGHMSNPTELRFELEASTELTLAFVSEKRAAVRQDEIGYERWLGIARYSLTGSACLILTVWIPAILVADRWAYIVAITMMIVAVALVASGLLGVLISHGSSRRIQQQAHFYHDSTGRILSEFETWKAKGNG